MCDAFNCRQNKYVSLRPSLHSIFTQHIHIIRMVRSRCAHFAAAATLILIPCARHHSPVKTFTPALSKATSSSSKLAVGTFKTSQNSPSSSSCFGV